MRDIPMKKIFKSVLSVILSLGIAASAEALSCGWEGKQFVIHEPNFVILGEALSYQISSDEKMLCLQRSCGELSFWKNFDGLWRNTQSILVKSFIKSYQFTEKALYLKTRSDALLVYEKDVCDYYKPTPSIAIIDVLTYSLLDDEKTIAIEHYKNAGATSIHKNMGSFWLKTS